MPCWNILCSDRGSNFVDLHGVSSRKLLRDGGNFFCDEQLRIWILLDGGGLNMQHLRGRKVQRRDKTERLHIMRGRTVPGSDGARCMYKLRGGYGVSEYGGVDIHNVCGLRRGPFLRHRWGQFLHELHRGPVLDYRWR